VGFTTNWVLQSNFYEKQGLTARLWNHAVGITEEAAATAIPVKK